MTEDKKIFVKLVKKLMGSKNRDDALQRLLRGNDSVIIAYKLGEITAEEQMINKLLYMTQLRNMIKGMKQISE